MGHERLDLAETQHEDRVSRMSREDMIKLLSEGLANPYMQTVLNGPRRHVVTVRRSPRSAEIDALRRGHRQERRCCCHKRYDDDPIPCPYAPVSHLMILLPLTQRMRASSSPRAGSYSGTRGNRTFRRKRSRERALRTFAPLDKRHPVPARHSCCPLLDQIATTM
jgi:hypothetical protein